MSDVVVARPVLEGALAGGDPAFAGFVRSGAVMEMKAFSGLTGDAGGYAVPKEIDAVIDATLKGASPIRGIANVVKVGSAGYRKLVTTGGYAVGLGCGEWPAERDGDAGVRRDRAADGGIIRQSLRHAGDAG